ncbi:MAG: Diaminopimelate epimerase [Candidatus Omnitrophica bacterium]|nr:Diaminopimelate epimerase [Candidatus Omnitrophota bacterium]
MKGLAFWKMAGAGNDFVIIDDRRGAAGRNPSRLAERLCDRKNGIGADGLLLLGRSGRVLTMRIFNADGSEAAMCGNGIRCLAAYAQRIHASGRIMTIRSGAGLHTAEILGGGRVRVTLTDPRDVRAESPLNVGGRVLKAAYADTGVPHAVVFVSDLDSVDVAKLGHAIRWHRAYAPKGANANFATVRSGVVHVRTYERGVEGETLACGTGSTAAALAAAARQGLRSPVTVVPRSGEKLKVYFDTDGGRYRNVRLEGPVRFVFEGRVLC